MLITKDELQLENLYICNKGKGTTVFPLKNAAAFFTSSKFWMRRSIEGGVYQRAAFNKKMKSLSNEK